MSDDIAIDSFPDDLQTSDSPAVCRICYGNSEDEVLLNPCQCSGSVRFSHKTCLMTWLKSGATACEICKCPYRFQKYVQPFWQVSC